MSTSKLRETNTVYLNGQRLGYLNEMTFEEAAPERDAADWWQPIAIREPLERTIHLDVELLNVNPDIMRLFYGDDCHGISSDSMANWHPIGHTTTEDIMATYPTPADNNTLTINGYNRKQLAESAIRAIGADAIEEALGEHTVGKGPADHYAILNDLRDEFYGNAEAKGFHDDTPEVGDDGWLANDAMKMALVTSEVSEVVEELREGHCPDEHYYKAPSGFSSAYFKHTPGEAPHKPEGVPAELADIIIRVLDYAGSRDIDIARAVREKAEFNAGREAKHGKQF